MVRGAVSSAVSPRLPSVLRLTSLTGAAVLSPISPARTPSAILRMSMTIFTLRVCVTGLLLLSAQSAAARAQAPMSGVSDGPCPYTACALKASPRGVVRAGLRDSVVARPGLFTVPQPFVEVFARSDSARQHARRFASAYNRYKWLALLSSGGLGLSSGLTTTDALRGRDINKNHVYTFTAALALYMFAQIKLEDAQGHLNSAVWWYNASLSR
jgi:hypothetical protein